MAYERNRFRSVGPGSHVLGSVVEYDVNRTRDSSGGWKWSVISVLLTAVAISFVYARFISRDRRPIEVPQPSPPPVAVPPLVAFGTDTNVAPKEAKPETPPKPTPEAKEAEKWAESSSVRPAREQTLLKRLADAERLGKLAIAVDTIEQLRARPSMADLDDKLARRLGSLNVKRLFSGEPVPWIAETTVRRGQTVHRIAREHGTTVAAVRQLNGLKPQEEPVHGRKLRVLEFPKAAFVVHKQTSHADLTLNGKLFKRYYLSTGKSTVPGAYPITSKAEEGPMSRFSTLGIRMAPSDMQELSMFLAPGSMLTISEM